MGATTNCVPRELRAGDTAQWTRVLAGFPASEGWSLGYTLVSPAAVFAFAAGSAGNDFTIDVPAATTAAWTPGAYTLQEYVAKDGARHTIGTSPLRILPDIAAVASGGLDVRSHARKVLDAIEAWLESEAPTAAAFEIAGRKLQNYPLTELLALRDRYRAEVAREERGGRGGRLLVRI